MPAALCDGDRCVHVAELLLEHRCFVVYRPVPRHVQHPVTSGRMRAHTRQCFGRAVPLHAPAFMRACPRAHTISKPSGRTNFQCESAHFDSTGARLSCDGPEGSQYSQVLEGAARHAQLARTTLSQRAFENHLRRPSYSVPLAVNVLALSDEFVRLPHECVPLVPPKVLYICHCGRNH